jgi:hypothetical protein
MEVIVTVAPLFCPRCESEYMPSVSECADCGVALVTESQLGERSAEVLPEVRELVLIRASSVGWAQNLSALLADAGISHRIEAVRGGDEDDLVRRRPNDLLPFGVYVRGEDEQAARAIDAAHLRSEIPDLPDEVEGSHDAEACPACGTAVAPGATECADCGLALAFEE